MVCIALSCLLIILLHVQGLCSIVFMQILGLSTSPKAILVWEVNKSVSSMNLKRFTDMSRIERY